MKKLCITLALFCFIIGMFFTNKVGANNIRSCSFYPGYEYEYENGGIGWIDLYQYYDDYNMGNAPAWVPTGAKVWVGRGDILFTEFFEGAFGYRFDLDMEKYTDSFWGDRWMGSASFQWNGATYTLTISMVFEDNPWFPIVVPNGRDVLLWYEIKKTQKVRMWGRDMLISSPGYPYSETIALRAGGCSYDY